MAGFISKIKKTILLFLAIFLLSVFDSSDAFAKICDGGVNCTGKTQTLCEEVAGCTWVVNPDLTDESSLTIAMCNAVTMATGTGAKVFASLVIISLGIGFFTGKISWGLILGVGGGIASIFGSVTIVAVISGSDVVSCIVGVKADCTSTSQGYDLPENSSPKSSTSANNNSSIKILCNSGFFGHINDLVCFDGIWYGASGFCEQTDCGDPNVSDPLDNGTWDVNQANDGETITGTCDNGFRGPVTIQCSENNFINMQGACDPLPVCDDSTQGYQTIWGSWSAQSAYVGQSVSAACDDPLGNAPSDMECVYTEDETAGIWQGGDNENCKVFQPCNDASTFMDLSPNGSWLSESVNHGDSIDGNCSYGNYDLPPELVCNDGSWESIGGDACPSQCIDADVNFDISLNGGTWPSQTVNYESTITANCPQQRSTYDDKPELTCGDEGIFTFNNIYCHEGCDTESDGFIAIDPADGSWSNSGAANSGDEVTATCTSSSADLPVLTCHDGTWTDNGFECYAGCTDADGFLALDHGSWQSQTTNHGTTVKGTCPNSSDVPTLKCNDGQWEDIAGSVCHPGCTNGSAQALSSNGSWPSNDSADHGGYIEATCPYGYTNNTKPRLTCGTNTDGQWDYNDVDCFPPCDTNSAGYVNVDGGTWSNNGVANNGSSITFTCNQYYTPSGSVGPLTCTNGVYTGSTSGSCIPITCPAHTLTIKGYNISMGEKVVSSTCHKYSGNVDGDPRYNRCCPDGRWAGNQDYNSITPSSGIGFASSYHYDSTSSGRSSDCTKWGASDCGL